MSGEYPPQAKWLGANVRGYGTVYAVTQYEQCGFALVGSCFWNMSTMYFGELKRRVYRMPREQQPYTESYEQLGSVYSSFGVELYVLTASVEAVRLRPPVSRRHLFGRGGAV